MALFFADTTDQITLGVQASNQSEATQFSSTTDEVFMRFYTNNNSPTDNLRTGTVIGSSNYDKTAGQLNNLYFGMLTGYSNLQKTMVLQKDRVGITTSAPNALFQVYGSNVFSSWSSLARFEVVKGNPANPYPAFVIDANGNIGFGTEAVVGQTVAIKGGLQVDSLQIGANGGGSPLITAPGMQPPTPGGYLEYNFANMCNLTDIILENSLYTSNTIFANTYSPFKGSSTIYYSGASLSNINVIYPYQVQSTNQGSAGSPTYTFQQNANTGIFEPANNNLAISTSGTEALRVNPVGNVGIGSQNPTVMLDVTGTIASPNILGSNLIQTFTNIANYTFINGARVTIGTILPTGSVPFSVKLYGNSTNYSYILSAINTSTLSTTTMSTRNLSGSVSTDSYSQIFPSGNYQVNIASTTPGIGAGSYFNSNLIASFTVGATDPIGTPTVTLTGTPTFSATYTYVSGIPYYGNGVTVTYPVNALTFTNIYNTIDPGSVITNVLTLNSTNYTYAQVFTNYLVSNANNNNTLSLILNSGGTSSTVSISRVIRNINNQSGVSGTLMSSILYLGASINETTMNVATFSGMPISSVTRIANNSGTPANPALGDLSSFTGGNTISTNDAFYSPYTQTVYNNLANVPTGTYAPTLPTLTGNHNYFTFLMTTTAALGSFVINFNSSYNPGIVNVYVYWVSLGQWYNAKYVYTDTANKGCGSSTYVSLANGDRYPITLPQGTTLSGYTNIYVNVQFNGSLQLSTLSITNS